PVPIPNTEVKPLSADGTWGEIPWESRTSPDLSLEERRRKAALFVVFGGVRPVGWSAMPGDRPNRPRRPGSGAPGRRSGGPPGKSGKPSGRGKPAGPRAAGQGRKPGQRAGRPNRAARGESEARPDRRTAAERRADE